MLNELLHGEDATQSMLEFPCHLFLELCNPAYTTLIAWFFPSLDDPTHIGDSRRGQGKMFVHQPEALQNRMLKN